MKFKDRREKRAHKFGEICKCFQNYVKRIKVFTEEVCLADEFWKAGVVHNLVFLQQGTPLNTLHKLQCQPGNVSVNYRLFEGSII